MPSLPVTSLSCTQSTSFVARTFDSPSRGMSINITSSDLSRLANIPSSELKHVELFGNNQKNVSLCDWKGRQVVVNLHVEGLEAKKAKNKELFVNELALLISVHHPHIVGVLGIVEYPAGENKLAF